MSRTSVDTPENVRLFEWCEPTESGHYNILTVTPGGAEEAILEYLVGERTKLGNNCLSLTGWLCPHEEEPRGPRVEATFMWKRSVLDLDETRELLTEAVVDVEYDYAQQARITQDEATRAGATL